MGKPPGSFISRVLVLGRKGLFISAGPCRTSTPARKAFSLTRSRSLDGKDHITMPRLGGPRVGAGLSRVLQAAIEEELRVWWAALAHLGETVAEPRCVSKVTASVRTGKRRGM